jgi:hypothetical protein
MEGIFLFLLLSVYFAIITKELQHIKSHSDVDE